MQFNGYTTTNYPNGISTTLAATNNGAGAPYSGTNTGQIGQFTSVTTLTSQQLLAMNVTPIQLLPAPGNNLIIVLNSFVAELIFPSTAGVAYVNGGSATLRFNLSPTLGTNVIYQYTTANGFGGLITANATSVAGGTVGGFNGLAAQAAANLRNQPLYVDLSAAITGGNSSLQISTFFSVVPV